MVYLIHQRKGVTPPQQYGCLVDSQSVGCLGSGMHSLESEVIKMLIYNVISISMMLIVVMLPFDFLEDN